jgi:hypothetical protein
MADRAQSDDLQGTAANAVEPERVFVSYASADAALANATVETLERRGLRCWIAPRDIMPGAQYRLRVIVLTPQSRRSSRAEWVDGGLPSLFGPSQAARGHLARLDR